MNIKKCEQGHFYNGDKYQTCPHCKESMMSKDRGMQSETIPQNVEIKPIQGYQINENMPETIAYGRNMMMGDTVAYTPNDAGMNGEFLYQNEEAFSKQQPVVQQEYVQNLLPVGWLVAVSGLEYGKQYPIFTIDNTIGSMTDNSICIQGDMYICPENHCVLSFDIQQQKVVLNLENSTGEVYLNNSPVTESCYLNHGDQLQIGGSVYMLFELCRDGFSWWTPLKKVEKNTEIDDIEKAFGEEQSSVERVNISDIREKVYQRRIKEQQREETLERKLESQIRKHNPSFSSQKIPVFAEVSARDVPFMMTEETNVLTTQCIDDMDFEEETNILTTATWRCPMCNGLNSEFANVCKICGALKS